MSEPLTSIQGDAEDLKGRIWTWIDSHQVPYALKSETREAMNELLDCLDLLEDHQEVPAREVVQPSSNNQGEKND